MLCAELERLEGEFDNIMTALDNPALTEEQREALQADYMRITQYIKLHQRSGHEGKPCFGERSSGAVEPRSDAAIA